MRYTHLKSKFLYLKKRIFIKIFLLKFYKLFRQNIKNILVLKLCLPMTFEALKLIKPRATFNSLYTHNNVWCFENFEAYHEYIFFYQQKYIIKKEFIRY